MFPLSDLTGREAPRQRKTPPKLLYISYNLQPPRATAENYLRTRLARYLCFTRLQVICPKCSCAVSEIDVKPNPNLSSNPTLVLNLTQALTLTLWLYVSDKWPFGQVNGYLLRRRDKSQYSSGIRINFWRLTWYYLPSDAAPKPGGRESNLRPDYIKSSALTTTAIESETVSKRPWRRRTALPVFFRFRWE